MHKKVGVDAIGFYTSNYFLDLANLAKARGIDADKFYVGLGQYKMSVPPPDEDIVTMAANAAFSALKDIDLNSIEMLLFATESGIDQSKAAGIYVHDLLNLPERCRVVELKQACYSATLALQLALPFIKQFPDKKVLLIASDIARYGINTPGESSQGAGAVAMVLSANPKLLALEPEYGVVTESVMDFWRPNYLDVALVDGKYSSKLYLTMLEKSWNQYCQLSKRDLKDHDYFCYHSPVPRLVEKAHQHLAKLNNNEVVSDLNHVLQYSRSVGNSYTAALYVSFLSLLDHAAENLSGKRVGFYSYGSGCVAEYFSGVIQENYQAALNTKTHQDMIANRIELTYAEYEQYFNFIYPEDGEVHVFPQHRTGKFRLKGIENHKRIYEKVL